MLEEADGIREGIVDPAAKARLFKKFWEVSNELCPSSPEPKPCRASRKMGSLKGPGAP